MKVLAKLVFGTLGCVLLISGIAVMSPRAVHAVVATIIRDQDNPARHPFATRCVATPTTSNFVSCDTPAIPAGLEVVIETITFGGIGDPSNIGIAPEVIVAEAGVSQPYALNVIPDSRFGQPFDLSYSGVQSLRLYADPGTGIECNGATPHPNISTTLTFVCTISGYFVTLP